MSASSGSATPPHTVEFAFACPCLNVHVRGRVSDKDYVSSTSLESDSRGEGFKVWIGDRAEIIKQPGFVTWARANEEDIRPSRRRGSVLNKNGSIDGDIQEEEEDEAGPRWRTCWMCKTKVYKADKIGDEWVVVNTKGIIWADALRDTKPLLPSTHLAIPLTSTTSNFGRPPQSNSPSLYPPLHEQPVAHKLIPAVQDPFFLPPPFIPSHPQLRDLCNGAVAQLNEQHQRLEEEVKEYIALKTKQMRDLEDKVRCEVELLWNKYLEIPGKRNEVERSRSSSVPRGGGEEKRGEVKSPVVNPIVNESVLSPPFVGGSSLLSASISANSFHAPPPPPKVADKVDDSITTLSKTMDKKSDARAVAMSHVFSVLDDHMQGREKVVTVSSKKEKEVEAEPEPEPHVDSWIEEERKLLADATTADESRTPRPPTRKELKEKPKAVTFEEPEKVEDGEVVEEEEEQEGRDQDEYVFDFELDEQHVSASSKDDFSRKGGIMRTRNMVEANLSRTFAADAPSHRAAWRKMEQGSSIYASLRRTSTDSFGDESDESVISKLAISVPLDIVMNRNKKASNLPAMERKTSLSEREGLFVPPLKAAMRRPESGPSESPRPTRRDAQPRKTSRSASVSREREQVKSYAADPGAVFEALADEQDGGSDEEDGEQEGTLRDSRLFIPPHVLARRDSDDGVPEVGWRSLVTS